MAEKHEKLSPNKISSQFRSRLSKLAPNETIRALVLVNTPERSENSKRPTRQQRRDRIAAIQTAAETAVPKIDEVLARHGGQRLSENVNALGFISIQATNKALLAVAQLDQVKSIIEDQPISLLHSTLWPRAT